MASQNFHFIQNNKLSGFNERKTENAPENNKLIHITTSLNIIVKPGVH
jgi:hypothetical protein